MCYRQTGKIDVFEMDLTSLDEEISEDSLTDEMGKSIFCALVEGQEHQSPPDELAKQVDEAMKPRHKTVARNAPQPFLKQLKKWTLNKLIDSNRVPFCDEDKD